MYGDVKDIEGAKKQYAITPSDTVPIIAGGCVRAIYVGGAGNVAVRAVNDSAAFVHYNVPAGSRIEVFATHVYATGTTATNMIGYG